MYSPHSHKHFIFLAVIAFILFSVTFSFAEKVSYTYDDLNRLTDVQYTAWKIHYDYDEAGNRTKKVISTGAAQSPEAVQGINLKPSGKKPLSSSSTASNTGTVTGSKTYTIIGTKNPTTGGSSSSGAVANLPKGDFNNDGQADILWRNNATGENKIWLMNGTSVEQEVTLEPVSDVNCRIAATGDFNNDGKIDIVWRNAVTGDNMIWLMDGVKHIDTITLNPVPDLNWKIVDARDFNGDSHTDILWRNAVTGENRIWLMNKTALVEEVTLEAVPADWTPDSHGP